jgi:hypothetical protein
MHTWEPEEEKIVETELFRIAGNLLPVISPPEVRARLSAGGSIDLFNGTAGVILFFLRLYDHCRHPVYLQACKAAADELLQHPAVLKQEYYTLYTGATGLIYLCIKMYEATGEDSYLAHALSLLDHFEHGILEQVVQDDLISGHAGNIFLLTYLYAHTKNDALTALVRRLTGKLIQHARIAPCGLRWGHIKRSFGCLTGFSHGAAGIAYALLQAAQYFRDDGLQYLAEQALAYEMLYYDEATANWLDLRLTSTRLSPGDILEWDLPTFRKYASNVNSWAHGAAGAGVARLYAWQLTGQDAYEQQARVAVQRSLHDLQQLQRGDFTLCSGYGGIASFLLYAAAALNQPQLRLPVQHTALAAVRYYQQHGTYNSYVPGNNNDPGLFSGMAGIGLLLLSALSPLGEDAVTHPAICAARHPTIPLYGPGEVKMLLFSRYYPNTISLLQLDREHIAGLEDIYALEALLQKKITALPPDKRVRTQDCYTFEHSLAAMWKQHKGLLYYTEYKDLLQASARTLLNAPAAHLLQAVLLPVDHVKLCSTRWPWHQQENEQTRSEGYHYLFCSHEQGISTFPVGGLTAAIIADLAPGRTLQAVIQQILATHFTNADASTREQISQAITTQVRSLLQQCFITSIPHK